MTGLVNRDISYDFKTLNWTTKKTGFTGQITILLKKLIEIYAFDM
jgi:hypothetical protein